MSETKFTVGCVLALAGALVCAAHAQERGRLLRVTAGGNRATSTIELLGDRPLSFTTLKLSAPPRVVVDFADTDLSGVPEELLVEDGTIQRVAAAAAGSKTARVVIELTADAEFDVSAHGSRVEVRVPRLAPLVAKLETHPSPSASLSPERPTPEPRPNQNPQRKPEPSLDAQKRASLPTVALVGSRPKPPPESDVRRKARDQRIAAYIEDQRAAAEKSAGYKKMTQDRQAAARRAAADKAMADQRAAAAQTATQRAAAAQTAAQLRADRLAAKRAAEEKALTDQRATAQAAAQRRADRQAAKRAAAEKAAAEQAAAAQANADRRAAKRAAAERQRLAAEQDAAKRRLAAAERAAAQKRVAAAAAGRSRPQRKIALAEPPRRAITGIGFRPTAGGEVIVRSDQPLEYGVSGEDHAILLHLPSTGIPLPNNRRPLDTRFFDGPVERVVPVTVPGGTDVRIELRRHAEYQLAQSGSVLTVTFSAPKP